MNYSLPYNVARSMGQIPADMTPEQYRYNGMMQRRGDRGGNNGEPGNFNGGIVGEPNGVQPDQPTGVRTDEPTGMKPYEYANGFNPNNAYLDRFGTPDTRTAAQERDRQDILRQQYDYTHALTGPVGHYMDQGADAYGQLASAAQSDMAWRKAQDIANRSTWTGGPSLEDMQWLYDNSNRYYGLMKQAEQSGDRNMVGMILENMGNGYYDNWTPVDKTPQAQAQPQAQSQANPFTTPPPGLNQAGQYGINLNTSGGGMDTIHPGGDPNIPYVTDEQGGQTGPNKNTGTGPYNGNVPGHGNTPAQPGSGTSRNYQNGGGYNFGNGQANVTHVTNPNRYQYQEQFGQPQGQTQTNPMPPPPAPTTASSNTQTVPVQSTGPNSNVQSVGGQNGVVKVQVDQGQNGQQQNQPAPPMPPPPGMQQQQFTGIPSWLGGPPKGASPYPTPVGQQY